MRAFRLGGDEGLSRCNGGRCFQEIRSAQVDAKNLVEECLVDRSNASDPGDARADKEDIVASYASLARGRSGLWRPEDRRRPRRSAPQRTPLAELRRGCD